MDRTERPLTFSDILSKEEIVSAKWYLIRDDGRKQTVFNVADSEQEATKEIKAVQKFYPAMTNIFWIKEVGS